MSIETKRAGDEIERRVCERFPGIERESSDDSPDWRDAVVASDVVQEPAGVVVEFDTPVEIKAACETNERGETGRYWIRERNHREILERGGEYVLVVYSPSCANDDVDEPSDLEIERAAITPASTVDAVIANNVSWTSAGPGRDTHAKVSWRLFFGSLDEPEVPI